MAEQPAVIGEVVESSTTQFVAECPLLYSPPPFGSFVKVEWSGDNAFEDVHPPRIGDTEEQDDPFIESFRQMEGSFGPSYRASVEGDTSTPEVGLNAAIYALVYQASTTSTDPGRRPRAYWKDEQRLREEQPELSEWMLLTSFSAMVFGYSFHNRVWQVLPPRPPKLHTPVYSCTGDEIRAITSRMDFLRTIINFAGAPTDEVIAACIREASRVRNWDSSWLIDAGKELARLLKDDYDRLQAIMRRIVL